MIEKLERTLSNAQQSIVKKIAMNGQKSVAFYTQIVLVCQIEHSLAIFFSMI